MPNFEVASSCEAFGGMCGSLRYSIASSNRLYHVFFPFPGAAIMRSGSGDEREPVRNPPFPHSSPDERGAEVEQDEHEDAGRGRPNGRRRRRRRSTAAERGAAREALEQSLAVGQTAQTQQQQCDDRCRYFNVCVRSAQETRRKQRVNDFSADIIVFVVGGSSSGGWRRYEKKVLGPSP